MPYTLYHRENCSMIKVWLVAIKEALSKVVRLDIVDQGYS